MNLQGGKHILNLSNIRPSPSNSALERALVLSQSQTCYIPYGYPDPRESIELTQRLREECEREIRLVAEWLVQSYINTRSLIIYLIFFSFL